MAQTANPRRPGQANEIPTKRSADVGRPPGTYDADSRVSRICCLLPGQSEALSHRLSLQAATREEVSAVKARLSNTLRAATRRATARTGYTYEIDAVDARTAADMVVITVVATRST